MPSEPNGEVTGQKSTVVRHNDVELLVAAAEAQEFVLDDVDALLESRDGAEQPLAGSSCFNPMR